jgi:hypothetical protein
VECEWNPAFDCIKYDFEKLLLANSTHKLFVCYVESGRHKRVIEYFKDALKKYPLGKTGERFMVAILDRGTKEFLYELV